MLKRIGITFLLSTWAAAKVSAAAYLNFFTLSMISRSQRAAAETFTAHDPTPLAYAKQRFDSLRSVAAGKPTDLISAINIGSKAQMVGHFQSLARANETSFDRTYAGAGFWCRGTLRVARAQRPGCPVKSGNFFAVLRHGLISKNPLALRSAQC